MVDLVFYEKPGCTGNARQKALLIAAGHRLEVRNLLSTPWTAESLRAFFGRSPVAEWFNPRAPAVRDGLIDPTGLNETEALAAMLATPLLIRRPLLQVGDDCRAGFDPAAIAAWIGLTPQAAALARDEAEACPQAASQSPPCPPVA
jgi:nitrogenase-associated protein